MSRKKSKNKRNPKSSSDRLSAIIRRLGRQLAAERETVSQLTRAMESVSMQGNIVERWKQAALALRQATQSRFWGRKKRIEAALNLFPKDK